MLKNYRWIFATVAIFVIVLLAFQVPWNSNVEREIVRQLNLDPDSVQLTPDGMVRWEHIINQQQYLPPEDNIMFDIVRLFGVPTDCISPDTMSALGAPVFLTPDQTIVELNAFLRTEHPNLDYDSLYALSDKSGFPWTKADIPAGELWVKKYNTQIDKLLEASRKKGYYWPLVVDESGSPYFDSFSGFSQLRSAARVLAARAMYHAGNGKIDQAIQDLAAIIRIGSKMNHCSTLVEEIVGIAINGIGFASVDEILSCNLSENQLTEMRELFSVKSIDRSIKDIVMTERMFNLSFIDSVEQNILDFNITENFFESDDSSFSTNSSLTHLEMAAKTAGEYFDELEIITQDSHDQSRLRRLKDLAEKTDRLAEQLKSDTIAFLAGAGSRGKTAGLVLANDTIESFHSVEKAYIRQLVSFDTTDAAICVELFRLSNDRYPETLEELVPEFLPTVPIDRYSGKPLNYAKNKTHYFIASVGADGVDELQAGMAEGDDVRVDDGFSWARVKMKND